MEEDKQPGDRCSSFLPPLQIPDVLFKHPLFFLIGPQGAAPTSALPPICSPGGQSYQFLPASLSHLGLLFTGACPDVTWGQPTRRGRCCSCCQIRCWGGDWWWRQISGQRLGERNWSQNHRTGGCRDTWRRERSSGGGRSVKTGRRWGAERNSGRNRAAETLQLYAVWWCLRS